MAQPVDEPLVITIPVNNDMVRRAFDLLTNRRVSKSEEHFIVSTEIVKHADMDEYTSELLKQYKYADSEVQGYLKRLKFNQEGTQIAKAIVVGTKNQFSISLIATSRRIKNQNDEHKILIATMKKKVEMSAAWNIFAKIFGIASQEQEELERIVSRLHEEESKKCLEAMVVYALGESIKKFLGSHVDVQFIQD